MENETQNCPECGWLNGQCDCEGEPPVRSSERVRRPMTIHEKHMEYVDKVNNSKTQAEYWHASGELHGFREGLRAAGVEPDLIACDLTQFERGHENRPMCCGVFNDWSPNEKADR